MLTLLSVCIFLNISKYRMNISGKTRYNSSSFHCIGFHIKYCKTVRTAKQICIEVGSFYRVSSSTHRLLCVTSSVP